MPKPTLLVRRATIKATPMYCCAACGKVRPGTTILIDLDHACPPDSLGDYIRAAQVSNNYMPVGWSGYGLYSHKCEACK